MRKRLLTVLLLCLLIPLCAMAEIAYKVTPVSVTLASVQEKLIELGYLSSDQTGDAYEHAAMEALSRFRQDQDIDALEEGERDVDARTIVRLMAQGVEVASPVWVPVYGGKRYHPAPERCGMNNPECVDLSTALQLGYTPCKRCYK